MFAKPGSKPLLPANTTPTPPRGPKTAEGRPRVMFRDAAAPPTAPVANKAVRPGNQGTAGGDGGRIIDHYILTQQIHVSTTTNAEIHCGRHRLTGELVTMKAIDRAHLAAAGRVPCAHSTPLYAQLEHEHIVRLHEVFDSQRMVLVLEWVPGITLGEFMQTHGCGPAEAQEIMQQLTSAVAYMHSAGVCHRDLRLNNVMLRAGPKCCVKVIDLASVGPAEKLLSRRTPIVPVYAAPELLLPAAAGRGAGAPPLPEYSGKAVDVWALGVIAHVLLTGMYPFTNEAECREGRLEMNEAFPEGVYELLQGMLCVDRAERLTANDVLKHPWLAPPPPAEVVVASGSPAAWLRAARTAATKDDADGIFGHGADGAEADEHEVVLDELARLGIDRKAVVQALENGIRDELTTAYCLLWSKRARSKLRDGLDGDGDDAAESPLPSPEKPSPAPGAPPLAEEDALPGGGETEPPGGGETEPPGGGETEPPGAIDEPQEGPLEEVPQLEVPQLEAPQLEAPPEDAVAARPSPADVPPPADGDEAATTEDTE